MDHVIETHLLTKRFGKAVAVDGLDLKVAKGSIFAFLGPNGAGKTTTIKILMNIIPPTSGNAEVLGQPSVRLGAKEFQKIGYVSENQEMPEWMTVGKFLDYCRSFYPQWDGVFCSTLVKQFDLPLDQRLADLSRGVRMKAALVSSLAYRPQLLVLDEPFSGLDPLVREEFINGILELTQAEDWTVFVSSHDVDEVERLADWVGMIDQGKLQLTEETESLQRRFKKVHISLASEPGGDQSFPDAWLTVQARGRDVHFVDSTYNEGESEKEYYQKFGQIQNLAVQGLTLKEIFIALAKHYKIRNIEESVCL